MRLKISHQSRYSYDLPVAYALQRLRMTPVTNAMQIVRSWGIAIEGATEEVRFEDHFGNRTCLLSISGDPHLVTITAAGEIETIDTAGVFGQHTGYAPLWLFEEPTALTEPGPLLVALAHDVAKGTDLDRLHALSATVLDRMAYTIGATDAGTIAEAALERGQGVCQDHAHAFLAAARLLGFPARYVSGYLMLDERPDQAASHAWAEVHVAGIGWVGFDVSNGISPDGRYVRLAVGRDYRDAMPSSGIRLGQAQEQLEVLITVEQ